MIIHYNCTIGSFLLHSFLLIYHPYPPSFHEMIFTLVYIYICRKIAARCTTRLARSRSPTKRMHAIVGERERSNCVEDMRCPENIVGTCTWGMKYAA